MSQIRLIIPYYGRWPVYLPVFFSSLERNNILRLALVTDLPFPDRIPENCDLIHLSYDALKTRISQVIHPDASLQTAYKLCDYKPAFADLFPELITGFPYWAFGDLDLVYGNIRASLPPSWQDFDILTFRREWVSGALTILKNSGQVNKLYRQSSSFPQCFRSAEYAGFDECFQVFDSLIGKDSDAVLQYDTKQSFSTLVREASCSGSLNVYQETKIKESIGKKQSLLFDLYGIKDATARHFLLYHYITEKKTVFFRLPCWDDLPSACMIDRYGFYRAGLPYSRLLLRSYRCQVAGAIKYLSGVPSRVLKRIKTVSQLTK